MAASDDAYALSKSLEAQGRKEDSWKWLSIAAHLRGCERWREARREREERHERQKTAQSFQAGAV